MFSKLLNKKLINWYNNELRIYNNEELYILVTKLK